jgi:hypothetical protein
VSASTKVDVGLASVVVNVQAVEPIRSSHT